MNVDRLDPLAVRISGVAETGVNPGWSGTVVADAPFAALLLVQVGDTVTWGKPEVISATSVPISLHLHPLNWAGTAVQFHFCVGWRGVESLCLPIAPQNLHSPTPSALSFVSGEARTFCTVASDPPATFQLLFLARSNVAAGRTGVWRPHKRFRGAFPAQLEAALFGGRNGTVPARTAA